MRRLGRKRRLRLISPRRRNTAGDIESLPYLEGHPPAHARRGTAPTQAIIHLTLVPFLAAAGELKTNPTQPRSSMLQSYGLQLDCSSAAPSTRSRTTFGARSATSATSRRAPSSRSLDAESIYECRLLLLRRAEARRRGAGAPHSTPTRRRPSRTSKAGWTFCRAASRTLRVPSRSRSSAIRRHQDAYKSISESLLLAAAATACRRASCRCLSDDLTAGKRCRALAGCLRRARGAGLRATAASTARSRPCAHARETGLRFSGICLGMQSRPSSCAQRVRPSRRPSTEFAPDTAYPVIAMMAEQKTVTDKGGTMLLGAYRAASSPARWPPRSNADELPTTRPSRSATGTASRSTTTCGTSCARAACYFTGVNPVATSSRSSSCRARPGLPRWVGSAHPAPPPGPVHPWFRGRAVPPDTARRCSTRNPLFVHFIGAAVAHSPPEGRLDAPTGPQSHSQGKRASARVLAQSDGRRGAPHIPAVYRDHVRVRRRPSSCSPAAHAPGDAPPASSRRPAVGGRPVLDSARGGVAFGESLHDALVRRGEGGNRR